MVFSASDAPQDNKGFKAWIEAELKTSSRTSSDVLIDPVLGDFYAEIRHMYTPFNGPDDVPLPDNAPQVRILRTCEYNFRARSIYMAFRWPAQDMARGACSTLSKELGLGFYNLSNRYPQARFPDGTFVYPMGNWKDEELKGKS